LTDHSYLFFEKGKINDELSYANCQYSRKIHYGDSGYCTSCSLYGTAYKCKDIKSIAMEARKQPMEIIPMVSWRIPSLAIAPASAKAPTPSVIQKGAHGDTPEVANTIPTITSITPAPGNPIELKKLCMNKIISHKWTKIHLKGKL
jgi:hypothetical protein